MGIINRYFGVESSGDGDGSSINNKAALFDGSGNWSSIITDFNFSGSDSLMVLISPGNYTCKQRLHPTIFSSNPNVNNPIFIIGVDNNFNRINSWRGWSSAKPATWVSELPEILCDTNNPIVDCPHSHISSISFISTNLVNNPAIILSSNSTMIGCGVKVEATHSGARGIQVSSVAYCKNIFIDMATNEFDYALLRINNAIVDNIRGIKSVGGGSGNRRGSTSNSSGGITPINRSTFVGFDGGNYIQSNANINQVSQITNRISIGGAGIIYSGTSSQNNFHILVDTIIVDSSGYGVDALESNVYMHRCRARNNTSGNFNIFGNYSSELFNDTSAGTNEDEFVDFNGGDYRVRNGSDLWGRGIGVEDEATGDVIVPPYNNLSFDFNVGNYNFKSGE